MPNSHLPYRSWARLLIVLLAITWTFRALHGVWLHGAEMTGVSCAEEHRDAPPHLHQGHEAERDCPFCAFVFAVAEPMPPTAFVALVAATVHPVLSATYEAPFAARSFTTIQLRGPPAP